MIMESYLSIDKDIKFGESDDSPIIDCKAIYLFCE